MHTSLKTYRYFLLSFVILAGFIIRVYRLDTVPAGFFCDEAATGYNAWSILKTGRDEYGRAFPAFFQSFGIWRGGLPFYATVPFVSILGLTEFASRLPSVIIGTASIPVVYLLTSLLFSEPTGLIAAMFLALSPWHIQFSRFAEANIYLPFFLTASVYLFILAVKRKSGKILAASSVLFGLAFYTYFPSYALVPLTIAVLIVTYFPELKRMGKALFQALFFLMIILIPFFAAFSSGTLFARLSMVSRATADRPLPQVVTGAAATYLDHFLPEFLFTEGDIGYRTHFITRYSVRGMGQLYLFQLPLLIAGVFYIARSIRKDYLPVILLMVLYPIGSTAAPFADGGGPFATRSILGVIPLQIVSAAGLVFILGIMKRPFVRHLVAVTATLAITVSFAWYLNAYFRTYNSYSQDFWGWQYGAREIMQYYLSQKERYDELYLAPEFNGPNIFLKFYDPLGTCRGKCRIGDVTAFRPGIRQLFSIRVENAPKNGNFISLYTVYYPDGKPAFYVGELTGDPESKPDD